MLHPNRSSATVYLHFETNGKGWRQPSLEPWEQAVSEGTLLQGSTVRGDSVTGEYYQRGLCDGEHYQRGLCDGGEVSEVRGGLCDRGALSDQERTVRLEKILCGFSNSAKGCVEFEESRCSQ